MPSAMPKDVTVKSRTIKAQTIKARIIKASAIKSQTIKASAIKSGTVKSRTVKAKAKINLYLHVLGRRADGYHRLQSLMAFADMGDTITICPTDRRDEQPVEQRTDRRAERLAEQPAEQRTDRRADRLAEQRTDQPVDRTPMRVRGPFAGHVPDGSDNLIWHAIRRAGGAKKPPIAIDLVKNLPAAAGIGGASADAAATLRVVSDLWSIPQKTLWRIALDIGADVPFCLDGRAAHTDGIGEERRAFAHIDPCPMLLVNPRIPLSTQTVFADFDGPFSPSSAVVKDLTNRVHLIDYLSARRNDLTAVAKARVPPIGDVLDTISRCEGCLIARMSGSGSTCFGLFEKPSMARRAHQKIAACKDWWVATTTLVERNDEPARIKIGDKKW